MTGAWIDTVSVDHTNVKHHESIEHHCTATERHVQHHASIAHQQKNIACHHGRLCAWSFGGMVRFQWKSCLFKFKMVVQDVCLLCDWFWLFQSFLFFVFCIFRSNKAVNDKRMKVGNPIFDEMNDALPRQSSSTSSRRTEEDNLQFNPDGRINILKMKLNGAHPSAVILEELNR